MSLVVYLAKELPQKRFDSLQQMNWEFPIQFDSFEKDELGGLSTGSIIVDKEGPKLVALAGQKAIAFSWTKLQGHWRSEASRVKASPVLRALGAAPGSWVIDATCGTGRDTSYFLHHGLNVVAYERNRSIFFLLKVAQVFEEFLTERLVLNFGHASELLAEGKRSGEIIYFDPMFDDGTSRKAKPKKNMEVFHELVGADSDALEEANKLRPFAKRLVIKRSPRDGELLAKPSSTWKTKSVRFDLYL